MTIKVTGRVASRLHALACDKITQSHLAALNEINAKSVKPSQWEAKFVAHLCKAMADVAKVWGSELAAAKTGAGVSMATVFTHQSPYVKWKNGMINKRCELADVLLAIIDRRANTPTGVAILVQAKLSSTGNVRLSSKSEKNQFDLFSTRPKFDLVSALAPTGIDLSGLSPDSALLYGLTGPSVAALPSNFSWPHFWLTADDLHRSAGTYAVSGEDCLAFTLVGMLLGNFGWGFALPPKGSDWTKLAAASPRDDWSTLINYLLAQTFSKPLSAAQSVSMGRLRRGQEDIVHLASKNPAGQRMFFIGNGMADSATSQYLGGGFDNDNEDWEVVSPDNGHAFDGGDDSTDGGEQLVTDVPPEGGPLSAILFEVGG